MISTHLKRTSIGAALVLLACLHCGCDYFRQFARDVNAPGLNRRGTSASTLGSKPTYPQEAEIGPPLDIEVIRDNRVIMLDNRTVRAYRDVELWLNQEYGGGLAEVPIGRGESLALKSFINLHGEHYPTAKFLEPDADQKLILAELVIDGKIHKLTVRLTEDWRRPQ